MQGMQPCRHLCEGRTQECGEAYPAGDASNRNMAPWQGPGCIITAQVAHRIQGGGHEPGLRVHALLAAARVGAPAAALEADHPAAGAAAAAGPEVVRSCGWTRSSSVAAGCAVRAAACRNAQQGVSCMFVLPHALLWYTSSGVLEGGDRVCGAGSVEVTAPGVPSLQTAKGSVVLSNQRRIAPAGSAARDASKAAVWTPAGFA